MPKQMTLKEMIDGLSDFKKSPFDANLFLDTIQKIFLGVRAEYTIMSEKANMWRQSYNKIQEKTDHCFLMFNNLPEYDKEKLRAINLRIDSLTTLV